MHESTTLNWDDLRFVVALARHGSLSRASRVLGVDHTTVGRRVQAAEDALGVRLFTRSQSGYTLTLDGHRLLPSFQGVADAVVGLTRSAQAGDHAPAGVIRVTAPETLGMTWLARHLCPFSEQHPAITLVLDPTGTVADLGRGEAEVALRTVRSREQRLIVKRVADIAYGLYASPTYLEQQPVHDAPQLTGHRWLAPPATPPCIESRWLDDLAPGVSPVMTSELSIALHNAAAAHAGIAILPRYLGDADPELVHLPRSDEPSEALWLTVHEDARAIPRVRSLLTHLGTVFEQQRAQLSGVHP